MLVDPNHIHDVLHGLPHVKRLASLCRNRDAYIVGGAVRNALLGLPIKDVDIISSGDPTELAKSFARQLNGSWFWLDKDRRQSRVVFNTDETCPDFDFAPFRAPTIGQDLLDRDFTINAIAISLRTDSAENELLDPLCGLDDLQNNLLRMVGTKAFANDPLRIIKGIRHATVLGVEPVQETLDHMQREVTGLHHVAYERIRQEIWSIVASENSSCGLRLLASSMVGNYLFSKAYSSLVEDLVERFNTCRVHWEALKQKFPQVGDWLGDEVEQGLTCETLILWTLMLVRIGKDLPAKLADEWMLSRKAQTNIRGLSAVDGSTLEDLSGVHHNERSFARWAHKKQVTPKMLLLSLAVIEPEHHADLITSWVPFLDSLKGESLDDLVSGHWLRSELGLQDGPEMAKALLRVRDAEISGKVKSTADAHKLLILHYKNID
jgi:tRNA nucleotidyltransferase/poly(A) polymerase